MVNNFASDLNIYASNWPQPEYFPADPVSAVLMHDSVLNEFVLDTVTASGTDWVVTFPTKRFYVDIGTGAAPKLFQRNFNGNSGACDDVTLNIYDREEKTTTTPTTFSPPPPTFTNSICWEANIITFNNSNVLGSQNSANINTSFQDGWLHLGFAAPTAPATYHTLGNSTNTTHIWGRGCPGESDRRRDQDVHRSACCRLCRQLVYQRCADGELAPRCLPTTAASLVKKATTLIVKSEIERAIESRGGNFGFALFLLASIACRAAAV